MGAGQGRLREKLRRPQEILRQGKEGVLAAQRCALHPARQNADVNPGPTSSPSECTLNGSVRQQMRIEVCTRTHSMRRSASSTIFSQQLFPTQTRSRTEER